MKVTIVDDKSRKLTDEEITRLASTLLPCGHPKSSLYEGKYTVEGGECVDCGAEYVKECQADD